MSDKENIENNAENDILINDYSKASYYIEQKFNDVVLGSGTGFFYKYNDNDYLITNWHVVTGKDPTYQKISHPQGIVPNKLNIYLFNSENDYAEWIPFEIDLYSSNSVNWYEKKEGTSYIDVVAILVDIPKSKYMYFCINELEEPYNENTKPEVSGDVYILGYPYGKTGGFFLPIWKRGSIASEPDIDIDNMPLMYVDTASRPGMSGSPVIIYERRPVSLFSESESKFSRYYTKLIGIYSGRYGDPNDINSQLGRVWKVRCIDLIIENK